MTSSGAARVVIELDLAADPIAGRIISPAGASRRFAGWLELMAALERARAAELNVNPWTMDANA
jgi:hypothetical protein